MSRRADSDTALIERYLRGDVSAFNDLMRAHEDHVFAICLRMLRDREAALDATQETFITVFRKVDRFSGHSAFSTWLYRVAVNTCYDRPAPGRRPTEPLPTREGLPTTAPLPRWTQPSSAPTWRPPSPPFPPSSAPPSSFATPRAWPSRRPPRSSASRWAL